MKDPSGTHLELIEEISALKQRIKKLEQSELNRKQFEKALQESENRLREITAQVPGVVYQFYVRPNGAMGFYYISDRSEMVVGLKPDLEGYFDRFSAIVIPEHRDGFIKSIEKSVNESSEWKYEGMLQKPSGEIIWFSGNSFPSPREDEMVFNGIVRDITAQKQSEKALHESEQRYRTVFENTGTATVIIEPDTTISLCNSEFERLSGYTSNEIEGRKSWTEFVVREDLDRMIARHRIRRENHDQGLQEYEFRFVPRTKEVRNIYLVVDIIPDSDKSVASLTDITERKQAEEKLQKAEEKYRNIFENSTEGLYRVNPEGHFVTVNPAATSILGYESPEELIGTVTDIGSQIYVYPEDREKALEMLKKEGFFKNFEVRNRKKDGSIVWVSANVHLVRDDQGNVLYHEGTSRDITLRKQAEEELKQHRDHLEQLVKERTAELTQMNENLQQEIAERKLAEIELKKSKETLEELNTALRVLLHQRDEDKNDLEDRVVSNVKRLVIPYIEKMKKNHPDPQQLTNLNILEANLNEIVSPFLHTIRQLNLTPRETQIAALIKDGKTTKEIAVIIGVATSSIDSYRNKIRTKLGLTSKKANLQSYLQSLK